MSTLFILFCLILSGCNSHKDSTAEKIELQATNTVENTVPTNIQGAYIRLTNNHFDFGMTSRRNNPDIPVDIEFTNTGKTPLVILKADVSCGCITAEYPKEPIASNQKGKIRINADLRAQEGVFNKTIFIKSNADNDVVLIRLVGEITK